MPAQDRARVAAINKADNDALLEKIRFFMNDPLEVV
jgi:hypothetical protein